MLGNIWSLLFLLYIFENVLSFHTSKSKPSTYQILHTNTSCTSDSLQITIELNRNFHGVVYAKGFPLEKSCRSVGKNEKLAEISLSASSCGVRFIPVDENKLMFYVSLNVQTDQFLQQYNDMDVTVTCIIPSSEMNHQYKATSRTGRKKMLQKTNEDQIKNIKTWMEIEGTSSRKPEDLNRVVVGEATLMLVKTFTPDGLGVKVSECMAYDGTGESTQKLMDEYGCPLDEGLLPSLELIQNTTEIEERTENEIMWGSDTSSQTIVKPHESPVVFTVFGAMFPAFKFPDRSNLHIKCVLQVCKSSCPEVSCNSEERNRGQRKMKDEILERIEIFNSVEVIAPGIDNNNDGSNSDEDYPDNSILSGSKTFCLSASKMAISFATLGGIFLCAVLAALWTFFRNRNKHRNLLDGSEQSLVVNDSPLSFTKSNQLRNWNYSIRT